MNDLREIFGEPIHVYTRAQAIEDGVLVDVSEVARQAGFTVPVAMTRTLFVEHVDKAGELQGRLWDLLFMLRCRIQGDRGRDGNALPFRVKLGRRLLTLKAVSGPGDAGEHVITVMFPEED